MNRRPILIIDDDHEIRESLVDVLQDSGYDVLSASNGAEGLKVLEGARVLPCLVLLDLMMPVMDGSAFRAAQLRDPKFADIPTILFSADGQLDKKAANIGNLPFVKKPIDLSRLLEITYKYCQ